MRSVREDIERLPRHERCRKHSYDGRNEDGSGEVVSWCYADDDGRHLFPTGDPTGPIDVSECEGCKDFVSQYIDLPLEVDDILIDDIEYRRPHDREHGTLVRVRPCDERYGGKTYLGILVADAPMQLSVSYDRDEKTLSVHPSMLNPMMVLPDTGDIVWGCESWWSAIEDPSELRDVTDEEIEGTWYMRLLRRQCEERKSGGE